MRRDSHVGRREFLQTTGAVAGVLASARILPRVAGAESKGKVRLAYLQFGWAATEIIHKEDLLATRGWRAEYTAVPGSPAGLVNAFAAGNVDAIDMSFALAAKMFEDRVPLKVTGVATAVLGAIVARKGAGIAKIEDLRGRKIAAIVGTSTFFDIRALTLKGYGVDLQKDTEIVTATSPPDLANLMAQKEVDAIVAWQPTSDQVVLRGDGVYLVKQIDLWRTATGRQSGYPVHVCYLVNPGFIDEHPTFPGDLNEAQKEAVDIWYNDKPRALEIVAEVTKLPVNVLEFAHGQTLQMLHGLSDDQIETLVAQLQITKGSGYLKSEIWDDPERVKKEFFWRG